MTSFSETTREIGGCLKGCQSSSVNDPSSFYEPTNIYYTTTIYQTDTNTAVNNHTGVGNNNISNDEWSSVCSSESTGRECSPGTNVTFMSSSPSTTATTFHQYSSGYYAISAERDVVRIVKRRNTANKKERRRTQSINTAFSSLRNKIPNVPADTKLSKIKTLRLATSYISYLTRVLEGDQDPSGGFRAELVPSSRKINAERRAHFKNELESLNINAGYDMRKCKGRTGWPQHVWASELKQE